MASVREARANEILEELFHLAFEVQRVMIKNPLSARHRIAERDVSKFYRNALFTVNSTSLVNPKQLSELESWLQSARDARVK